MKKTTLAMAAMAVMGWHGPTRAEMTLDKRCARGIHETPTDKRYEYLLQNTK